jgi:hypothetical protein
MLGVSVKGGGPRDVPRSGRVFIDGLKSVSRGGNIKHHVWPAPFALGLTLDVSHSRKKLFLLLACLLVLGIGLAAFWFTHASFPWEDVSDSQNPNNREPEPRNSWLNTREKDADETYWAKEMLAQACGATFETFWDSINATTNKFALAGGFPLQEISLPEWSPIQQLPHGIEMREGIATGPILSAQQWREWVGRFGREGWQIDTLEFRHNRFDTDEKGQPWRSHFYFTANLTHTLRSERASLQGDLIVDWTEKRPGETSPAVKRLDASHLKLMTRIGEPFFKRILHETITPSETSPLIDPLILYDLDGDGLSEIVLAGNNRLYHRRGDGHYEAQPLCRYPVDFVTSALIADFDNDGVADLLCANRRGLFLFKGSASGAFDEPPHLVWAANPPLKNAMVLTCGDIDDDGDLDVFLGQYKVPLLGQVLRPYYYDANDSWPSYLLVNDGHGNFTEATSSAGVGSKRWRRTYSASLVDLDGDGYLDLVVVSDFAGLDLYRNDGHGRFTEMTRQWVAESHGFGMAHALADFNADGRLDLLMIGMPSPTVDRLEHLGLWRPYSSEDRQRRSAMTFGNRLYLARPDGAGFAQTTLSESIARSGWSWGCSAFDFDNDGFPDLYIANGLQTKQSVRDYESEFWLHDLFVDDSVDDVTASKYLLEKFARTRGSGWSYGGYEKNRLYLNQRGESFVELGHLAGVALEQDSRNVVADDLDGDGREEIIVTTLEAWPALKQTLNVYENRLADPSHWIGFRFREQGDGKSPVGVQITIRANGSGAIRQIVTGDSHRSQHANTVHFGLGGTERVERAEIRWMNGAALSLHQPAVDRYHVISAAAPK